MNIKEKIEMIKQIFSATTETVDAKFVDVKTQDGMILRIDNIEIDALVQEVTEAGLVDVLDGDYVLEDGLTLRIVASKIAEIIEATPEDVENETPDMTTEEYETVEGASAYMELPVGVHTIGDKIYTVVEVIKNEGMEDEYKCNEIVSIEPIVAAEYSETTSEFITVEAFESFVSEMKSLIEGMKQEFETVKSEKETIGSNLETIKQEFAAFKSTPSDTRLNKTYDFSANDVDAKLKALRRTK